MAYEDGLKKLNEEFMPKFLEVIDKKYPKQEGLDGPMTLDMNKVRAEYFKRLKELKKKYNVE